MALKSGPALRAVLVWERIAKGTLHVEIVPGTRVLMVSQHSRLRRTWHRREWERILKRSNRIWLGRGTCLVPRWDPIELHHDPIRDADINTLTPEELSQRGMFHLDSNRIVILIYQHVEDLLHLQRQQRHIEETYLAELAQVWDLLEAIENFTFQAIGEEIDRQALSAVKLTARDRETSIQTIRTILASRGKAADILVASMQRAVKLILSSLRSALKSEPIASFETNRTGLQAYLKRQIDLLDDLMLPPVARMVGRSQHHLTTAIGAIYLGKSELTIHQIQIAIRALSEAQASLQQPLRHHGQ